jgi:hypothetical protein
MLSIRPAVRTDLRMLKTLIREMGKYERYRCRSPRANVRRTAFELARSLQDTSGIGDSETKDQASRTSVDERYEREAGC